mmetsp:Transcript_27611/g.38549  ORF Transcript_27611/g.38549 Transcript_27611/m.38549 type:complete len:205 (+) Transcript_27611:734-1348(+)
MVAAAPRLRACSPKRKRTPSWRGFCKTSCSWRSFATTLTLIWTPGLGEEEGDDKTRGRRQVSAQGRKHLSFREGEGEVAIMVAALPMLFRHPQPARMGIFPERGQHSRRRLSKNGCQSLEHLRGNALPKWPFSSSGRRQRGGGMMRRAPKQSWFLLLKTFHTRRILVVENRAPSSSILTTTTPTSEWLPGNSLIQTRTLLWTTS